MQVPAVPKKSDPALPRVADGFRLVRELGRGGMGVVYHAEELASGRAVALKVLAADLSVSGEAFERFRREARTAAAISDSRCVFVYGAHQFEGSPAIAMELCPGETLEHRIAKADKVPIDTAVRWTIEILEGLEAAHRAGIVHRDVKPSNCFVTHDDHVKVGDFGLSRSLDTDIRLTQSGAFLGSPLYASPEQIKGREVDLRSDIYSCGATLYALLAGRAPYHGQNLGEVLARILSEDPPKVRSLRPDVPAVLEKVLERAMARDPERRFKDHESFRAALEPFAAGEVQAAARIKRVIAFFLDQMVHGAINAGVLFLAASSFAAFEMDAHRPGRFQSPLTILLMESVSLLYFALFEGLAGCTPAKWALGLRVVDARTNEKHLGRAALRALVFLGPGVATTMILHELPLSQAVYGPLAGGMGLFWYAVMASAMRKANGYRGLHELASGTRTLQAPSPFARFRQAQPVPVHAPERDVTMAPLGAYTIEGRVGVTPSGSIVQATDPALNRLVWIHARDDANAGADEARRSLARPGRLRWLERVHAAHGSYDVFESPGGASFRTCVEGTTVDWSLAHRLLSGLADELAQTARGPAPATACIEQVWIDRTWTPRLLDEPIGAGPFDAKSSVALLSEAARLVFGAGDGTSGNEVAAGLPASATPVVRKLLGDGASFADAEVASRELRALAGRPMSVSRTLRALQLVVSTMAPAFGLTAVLIALTLAAPHIAGFLEKSRYIRELRTQETAGDSVPRMDAEDRSAREILIAHTGSGFWENSMVAGLHGEERAVYDAAVRAHPPASPDELARAHERVIARPFPREPPSTEGGEGAGSEPAASATTDAPVETQLTPLAKVSVSSDAPGMPERIRWLIIPFFVCVAVGVWGVLAVLMAAIFRGGLSLKVFGIAVRDARGGMASRARCVWRAVLAWVPLILLYGSAAVISKATELPSLAITILLATALLHAAAIAYAIWRPSRSIHDRLARTRLVPR